jgi:aspartate kinase
MKIYKFGGTSVGSAQRMQSVYDIINTKEEKIVVLSAMSGTTNKLLEIADYLYKNNFETASELIFKLETNYLNVINELFKKDESKQAAKKIIGELFENIKAFIGAKFTDKGEKIVVAQGELFSTNLFTIFLREQGVKVQLLPALDFMRTNSNGEPDYTYIKENLNKQLVLYPDVKLFITQGFICKDINGEIDNLKRGGSDYSASIIGAAITAEEIQIWTDIDGMHNNDPRIVENTKSIDVLSFDEAAELAYFGAKILHPLSILPAKYANIPVLLKNTMDPKAHGTYIMEETDKKGIKAIAAKDDITMIKIKSGRMLLAYGFLRRVFEIFENYQTPIDMITTSEVGVSVTIDNLKNLNEIITVLKEFGSVTCEQNQTIICMVGYQILENNVVTEKIFKALNGIPVQMISYGGSNHNISVLINTSDKKDALVALNKHLF